MTVAPATELLTDRGIMIEEPSAAQMLVFSDNESHPPDTRGIEVTDLEAAEAAAISGLSAMLGRASPSA